MSVTSLSQKERRNSPRIPTNLRAALQYQEKNSQRNDGVIVKDISMGGVRIRLKNIEEFPAHIGQPIFISLYFSSNEATQLEKAEIVWISSNMAEAGLKFIELSSDTHRKIVNRFLSESSLSPKIPHNTKLDYDENFISQRRQWLERTLNTKLCHIAHTSQPALDFKGNIEQFIGVAQIPIGIAGPLKINGQYAKGNFYVPLATTEGALVMTYNRGMKVLTEAGGVSTSILQDFVHISPSFPVEPGESLSFIQWIQNNFQVLKVEAEKTTRHGKLQRIEPFIFGDRVVLKFVFTTADAQGLNMINKATEAACKFIEQSTSKPFYLRSNYSSVKKVASANVYCGYGKSVQAEAVISPRILKLLNTTPQKMVEYYISGLYSSFQAGIHGVNGHAANAVAALFVACGQDIADVAMSHVSSFFCSTTKGGDLRVTLHLPNLLIGTVGGGTGLGTQKECLELLGCYGQGKAKKFAEIIASTVLAGEISVIAAVVTGSYVQAHEKYGRNRPQEENMV